MTGQQIVNDALRHAAVDGYQVNNTYAIDYINAAIDMIIDSHDEIGKKESTTFSIDNANISTWLDLPDDFLAEKRIYYTGSESKLISATEEPYYFLIENDQIRFDFTGEYTMEYLKVPDTFADISQVPDIPTKYHRSMAFYVAYRVKAEIFGEESSEKNNFLSLFEIGIRRAAGRLNTRKKRKLIPPPRWS